MKTPHRQTRPLLILDDGVSKILEDVVRRRHAGESVDDEAVLQAHPSLRVELEEGLRRLKLLESARQDAARAPEGLASFDLGSHGLQVRCPACRRAFSCQDGDDWTSLDCPGCGQGIRLTEELAPPSDGDGTIRIAHFELEARVGQGGFGTVWRARDGRLDRIVAVKIPRRGRLMGEAEIEGFLHEARVAAQLRHPGIVTVHEIGREHGTVYIVSDFIDGQSLSRDGIDHELSVEEVAATLATVCRALHEAHELGVTHRDLKPQNIMVDRSGKPYITDFGLARRESDEVTASIEGALVGTPAYMPPEQVSGGHWVDRRGDIWSLGVILYELLSGELPFRGQVRMLLRQIAEEPVTPPSRLAPGIPEDLETITLKCLEKEPALRYRTAAALADDLERFLDGEPIVARPTSSWERAWRWCKRRPLVPSLALSVIFGLAATGAWAWRDAKQAVRDMDRQLTARALEANGFAAKTVADAVTTAFEERFQAVQAASADHRLLQALVATHSLPGSMPPQDVADHPSRRQLQIELERIARDSGLDTFAWFVQGPDGRQLARVPALDEETIGRAYGHRSYFHGEPEDRREGEATVLPTWRGPRLSTVFATERSDRYALAISNPLRDETESTAGVIGVMLEVGAFAEIPGDDAAAGADRFAVLIDQRTQPPGLILHHPRLADLPGARRRALIEEHGEERLCAPAIPSGSLSHYADPLDRLASGSHRRWLASHRDVSLDGSLSGLGVVVQEDYETLIGSDVDDLSRRLGQVVWTAMAALFLLLAAFWFVLTRRLAR